MSIFYRIILILLFLAACYSTYGIVHFKWMYHSVENPKADFLVQETENSKTTIVEFLNYGCGFCKETHPVLKEVLKIRPDLRYVARPISFGEGITEKLTRIALAAGLQGKFWEFHEAFLEYPEIEIPDSFIQETASLYGVDYDQLINDAEGKEVRKITEQNYKALEHAGLYSVPSFMINKRLYTIDESGAPDLKKMLDIVAQAHTK